jgi:hypothetical protein
MGLVKQWLLGQADEGRIEEFREWFRHRFGREPRDAEYTRYWDDFELDEAYEWAINSPGND